MSAQSCLKHDGLPFEYFCTDHDVIVCKECLVESHHTCSKTMLIVIASKGAKQSQYFIDSTKHIQQVLETVNEFTKDRREHIESIDNEINQVKEKITSVKQGWISYLESLEKSLLENVQRQKDKVVANIKEEIFEAEQIKEHIIKQKYAFEFVEKHGSDKQAFLLAQTSKTDLSDVEDKLSPLAEKAKYSAFNFVANEPCDTMKSIGSISIVETCVPVKERQSPVPVVARHQMPSFMHACDINIKSKEEHQSPVPVVARHQMPSFIHACDIDIKSKHDDAYISGIAVIDNDMLVLCDYSHSRLLIYNDNNQYQYQIKTNHTPRDITTIAGTNMVVVSSIKSDYIQFIDIIRKKLYNDLHVTGSVRGGVAASNTNLFVCGLGSIHVFDHQGHSIRKIKTKLEKHMPWYITICSRGNICYSDDISLYCIKPNGEEVFTYHSPNLRGARCVTTDNHGNVVILGCRSNNIHRLRPDGTLIDIILKEDDNIKYPEACCFNRNYRKVYVSNHIGGVISVFKGECHGLSKSSSSSR